MTTQTHYETLYHHETECRECRRTFTADVRLARHSAATPPGDYLFAWVLDVPAQCPDCEGTTVLPVRRVVDPDDVSLSLWHRINALVRDPVLDPHPSQDEQVETLLETVDLLADPIDDGIDQVLLEAKPDRARPFWYAKQHLDDAHFATLRRRAHDEYGVDIDTLVTVGRQTLIGEDEQPLKHEEIQGVYPWADSE